MEMDAKPFRVRRYTLFAVVILLFGIVLVALSRIPYPYVSQLLLPRTPTFPPETYAARYERLTLASLLAGLFLLVTAATLWLGRNRLPARLSRFAGRFSASYRLFRADLGREIKETIADRHALAWLALLSLAGIVVRIWCLNQPMRYDEAHTYLEFVLSGIDRLFYYPVANNHIAHTLLVYLSTSIFGGDLWAIRLPAFLAGILLTPATYLCARTVFDRSSGLIASGLVAGSPYLVLYATNARGYSGMALLTIALVPLCLYFLRKESIFAGFLIALLAAVGLYTLPVMLFPLAMLLIWIFFVAFQAGGMAKTLRLLRLLGWVFLSCAIVTLVLYTPVVISTGMPSIGINVSRPWDELLQLWSNAPPEIWMRYHRDIPGLVQASLGGFVLIGILYLWRANRQAFLLIPAALLGSGLIMVAMRTVPFQRTWIFFLPLGACLADVGVTALTRFLAGRTRAILAGALGLLFALGISYHIISIDAVPNYPDTGTFPGAEEIALALEPHVTEEDWVLARKNLPLRYYFLRLGMPLEAFYGGGDGDIYVVVQTPRERFEEVTGRYDLQLDEDDFVVQELPSALLYLPRGPGD